MSYLEEEKQSLILWGEQSHFIFSIIQTAPEYQNFIKNKSEFCQSPYKGFDENFEKYVALLEDVNTNKIALQHLLQNAINIVLNLKEIIFLQKVCYKNLLRLVESYPAKFVHSQLRLLSPTYNMEEHSLNNLQIFVNSVKNMKNIIDLHETNVERHFYLDNLNKVLVSTPSALSGVKESFVMGSSEKIHTLRLGNNFNIKNQSTGNSGTLYIENKTIKGQPKGIFNENVQRNTSKINAYKNNNNEIIIWTGTTKGAGASSLDDN